MKISAPLSPEQYGLYAECAQHPGEAYYNIPYFYVLDDSLDAQRLCQAVEKMVYAHPTLFTTIYNGRTDKRFMHSIGMVVKTLPVYAKFDERMTVLGFQARRARQQALRRGTRRKVAGEDGHAADHRERDTEGDAPAPTCRRAKA